MHIYLTAAYIMCRVHITERKMNKGSLAHRWVNVFGISDGRTPTAPDMELIQYFHVKGTVSQFCSVPDPFHLDFRLRSYKRQAKSQRKITYYKNLIIFHLKNYIKKS